MRAPVKLLEDVNLLVITGEWNKNIFSPEWISRYLLPNERLDVEIPLNIDASARMSTDAVRIAVVGKRLIFTSRKNDDTTHDFIQTLGLKIADYLPHTPVNNYSINFMCQAQTVDFQANMFEFKDDEIWKEAGAAVVATDIQRRFQKDNHTFNLRMTFQDNGLRLETSYYFTLSDLVDFKEKLSNNPVVGLKHQTLSMLSTVYDMEISP